RLGVDAGRGRMRLARRVAFAVTITALLGVALVSSAISRFDAAHAQNAGGRIVVAAAAQKDAVKQKDSPKAPAAPKGPAAAAKKGPTGPGIPPAYATMPLAERVALQFDLAWSGDYNGLINGEINDRTVAAVRALQTRNKFNVTGVLAPNERAVL